MPDTADQLRVNLGERRSDIYKLLLSGDDDLISAARGIVAAYREWTIYWDMLDFVDQINLWVDQAQDHPEAKSWTFMNTLFKAARDAGAANPGDWLVQGTTARVILYAGRYRKAKRRFNRFKSLIGAPGGISGLPADKRLLAWDIWAARAEFHVYVGFPGPYPDPQYDENARDEILAIPTEDRLPWHNWVRAFALHQLAYAERVPFGTAPSDRDPQGNLLPGHFPGAEGPYMESNSLLDQIDGSLSPSKRIDINLLRMANWGALLRRRQVFGGDSAEATAGFDTAWTDFSTAPLPSSNSTWSWKKERRGRFPKGIYFLTDPVNNSPHVRYWRRNYRNHYYANLQARPNGLPDLSPARPPDDGDNDQIHDHVDDYGE